MSFSVIIQFSSSELLHIATMKVESAAGLDLEEFLQDVESALASDGTPVDAQNRFRAMWADEDEFLPEFYKSSDPEALRDRVLVVVDNRLGHSAKECLRFIKVHPELNTEELLGGSGSG